MHRKLKMSLTDCIQQWCNKKQQNGEQAWEVGTFIEWKSMFCWNINISTNINNSNSASIVNCMMQNVIFQFQQENPQQSPLFNKVCLNCKIEYNPQNHNKVCHNLEASKTQVASQTILMNTRIFDVCYSFDWHLGSSWLACKHINVECKT